MDGVLVYDGLRRYVVASCCACGATVKVNPTFCPSLVVNGENLPLCRSCFDRWNEIHMTSKGLDPKPLHPNAYEPEELK